MKVVVRFFKFVFKSILFLIIAGAAFTFYRQWRISGERKNAYVASYWPDTALTERLPKPDSEEGRITYETDSRFTVYVPTASAAEYTEYANACMDKGFTVDYRKWDQSFSAEDAEGYSVDISYYGQSKEMKIDIDAPMKSIRKTEPDSVAEKETSTAANADSTGSADSISTQKETTAETEKPGSTASPESAGSDAEQEEDENLINGMHKDFVEAMDSYREFFHSYCEFMKSYDATDISMLGQYAEFMAKYADYMAKLEGWNQDEMNSAELAYYIQVTADIEKELAEVIQTMN